MSEAENKAPLEEGLTFFVFFLGGGSSKTILFFGVLYEASFSVQGQKAATSVIPKWKMDGIRIFWLCHFIWEVPTSNLVLHGHAPPLRK